MNVLGLVTSCAGAAMVVGSFLVSYMPKPKDRVKVVFITMLISMGSENFILAFSREPILWCISQVIGWILVPVMGANLEVILRSSIPVELQGRVYACRNTLQFFTRPIGLFLGGFMVDSLCEPFNGSSFKFCHAGFTFRKRQRLWSCHDDAHSWPYWKCLVPFAQPHHFSWLRIILQTSTAS